MSTYSILLLTVSKHSQKRINLNKGYLMEEMLTTYQDALNALSELQDVLDTIDTEEILPAAFDHLIETYKEARQLFLDFISAYIEHIVEHPIGSHTPFDILIAAHQEKCITGKEFKLLSNTLGNAQFHTIAHDDDEAQHLVETITHVHDTMQAILEEIEL